MQKTIIGYWFLPKRAVKAFIAVFLVAYLNGCSTEPAQVDSSGKVKVEQTDTEALAGWQTEDFQQVIPIFSKNCHQIMSNKNTYLSTTAQIKIKTADMQDVCRNFEHKKIHDAAQMRDFLNEEMVVYAVSDDGKYDGKITSYYEAIIHASFKKTERYKYPIYGKPKDLVEINLRDFDTELPNIRLVGRIENGRFVPYYKRGEIENNGINAPVLMWGDDLVDIHFMQIQGSAIAKMADGSELRIGYADNNGHKFRGIGSILLQEKMIKPQDVSMPKIREWLRKNPDKAKKLMQENHRFIFQRITNNDGPLGAYGIPLTAGRSLAVDNQYIPLGTVMWLDTTSPDKDKIQKIVFAQDIGSAIKGVVRGDYFWGHGEAALQQAGRMNSVGRYYIFAPRKSGIQVQ